MEKERKGISKPLIDSCPECGSKNLVHDYDSGETICSDCGLVLKEQIIDRGPEWRAFTDEEKATKSRVGMPSTYAVHDKSLSTGMGNLWQRTRDASGKELPSATKAQMWRLTKWQIRSRLHTSIDRNLAQAMAELARFGDKFYLPKHTKEEAAVIYRKALEKKLIRGRSIGPIIAAALYAACRITRTPRTLGEISEGKRERKKEIARCYRLLIRELDLQMPIAEANSYISKIAGMIGISQPTQGLANQILLEAKRKRIPSGKGPLGLAAAALYIACRKNNENKTQKDIAEVAGVTEVTVRNRYKQLNKKLGLGLPNFSQGGRRFKRAIKIRSFL